MSGARVRSVVPNLPVDDVDETASFWSGFLGLRRQEVTLGWVAWCTR